MPDENDIKAWLNNPKSGSGVYGRDWDQLCQALMWQLCDWGGSPATPRTYASAVAARQASTIVSTDASKAPAGAFHYWDIGKYGHVGFDMAGGGTRVLMATSAVAETWAKHVGVQSVDGYSRAKGATYRGWSHTNGINDFDITPLVTSPLLSKDDFKLVARFLNNLGLGKTTTTDKDGIPGSVFYWLAQTWGSKNGHYPQPAYKIDGKPGTRTNAIITGPLLAAAKAWAATPTTPPAWVPPTKAQYDALMLELADARKTITALNAEVAGLGAKIEAGRKALA